MKLPAKPFSHVRSFRAGQRSRLWFLTVVVLGAAAMMQRTARSLQRRQQIQRGELRELSDMRTVVDGGLCYARLSVDRHSRGYSPVILVHGFGVSSSYFVPTAERLAPYFDVYAPDLPGHGQSARPARPLDVEGLAESLRSWIDVMQISRASLVAHSMGCQMAVELAVRYPDLVDRLVLIGPTMDRAARSLTRLAPRFLAGGPYERVFLHVLLAQDYLRMARRIGHELRAMLAHRIEEKLPRISAPVLFVRGEKDPIAPLAWVNELAQLTPHSHVALIPRWGHAVQYSAADELVRVITPFLRRNTVAAKSSTAPQDRQPEPSN